MANATSGRSPHPFVQPPPKPAPPPLLRPAPYLAPHGPVPMECDGSLNGRRAPLDAEERRRRAKAGVCVYSAGPGHGKDNCSVSKARALLMGTFKLPPGYFYPAVGGPPVFLAIGPPPDDFPTPWFPYDFPDFPDFPIHQPGGGFHFRSP